MVLCGTVLVMEEVPNPTITLSRVCVVCQKRDEVTLAAADYSRYLRGEYAQTVWPDKTSSEREWIISGTHGDCWNSLFPEED